VKPEEELHGREFLAGRDPACFQFMKPLLVFSRETGQGQFSLKQA
jgi:hypothetical protein